jgi:hypothetical protein
MVGHFWDLAAQVLLWSPQLLVDYCTVLVQYSRYVQIAVISARC